MAVREQWLSMFGLLLWRLRGRLQATKGMAQADCQAIENVVKQESTSIVPCTRSKQENGQRQQSRAGVRCCGTTPHAQAERSTSGAFDVSLASNRRKVRLSGVGRLMAMGWAQTPESSGSPLGDGVPK